MEASPAFSYEFPELEGSPNKKKSHTLSEEIQATENREAEEEESLGEDEEFEKETLKSLWRLHPTIREHRR
jgi:hypothetical protein